MNVLILGNGAREHAINYMLCKSDVVKNIYTINPNYGMECISNKVFLDYNDTAALREFIKTSKIDLLIVGPEQPLVDGVTDKVSDLCRVFGPTKDAAMLEGSKDFSKQFMNKYDIPTAMSETVTTKEEAFIAVSKFDFPHVYKVDGLAGGKGVIITNDEQEDAEAIRRLFVTKEFGDSAKKVIIEEFLDGEEISVFALLDNNTYTYFSNAKDFKRAYDDDMGPNTGGMGSLSPIDMTEKEQCEINEIIEKTFYGIKSEGLDYRGVVFIGLMKSSKGIKVLEYNVRFGDPETQVILPRLKSDFFEIMYKCAGNELSEVEIEFNDLKALNVVVASRGYPGKVEKNKKVMISDIGENILFYASCFKEDELITKSGRVFSLVSMTKNFANSRQMVYHYIDNISFDGAWYRKDIK